MILLYPLKCLMALHFLLITLTISNFGDKCNLAFDEAQTLIDNLSLGQLVHMKMEEQHLVVGTSLGVLYHFLHDGSEFVEEYRGNFTGSIITSVELEESRKWIFKGEYKGVTQMFIEQASSLISNQNITLNLFYINELDVNSHGYLAITAAPKLSLYLWNGQELEQAQQIIGGGVGVKICSDNTLLFTSTNYFYVYKNNTDSNLFEETQKFTFNYSLQYHIAATNDCSVILLTKYVGDLASFNIFMKNQDGTFYQFTQKIADHNQNYRKASINPDGDIVVLPGILGVDVWKYTPEENDYILVKTFQPNLNYQRFSAAITDKFIAFHGKETVKVLSYFWGEEKSFGNKQNFALTEIGQIELDREIIDLKLLGSSVLSASLYSGSFFHKKVENSFSLEKNFSSTIFISCFDFEPNLNLFIQGGYDKNVYAYLKGESEFTSIEGISTNSQILHLDLNFQGDLLLGHMNGDLSRYYWSGQSTFIHETTLSNEGSRVEMVKMCSEGEMLILLEKEGQFYFRSYAKNGTEMFNEKLEELLQVKFAATDDCQQVVILSTLLMRIDVFHKSGNFYSHFRKIQEAVPLAAVSLNPDGDVLLVSRHTENASVLYNYDECTEEYKPEKQIQEGADDSATAITENQIALGNQDGIIKIYEYSFATKQCDSFGKKKMQEISLLGSVATPRSIQSLSLSGNFFAVVSKFVGAFLYQVKEGNLQLVKSFEDSFFSGIKIADQLNTLVVGSYEKRVEVYKDAGEGYDLAEEIPTTSQVLCVDISEENKLLVGMMNGDVAQFSSDGTSFLSTAAKSISHAGGRVSGVKMCPEGVKMVLLQVEGKFKLSVYAADHSVISEFTEEFEEELIELFLTATSDCKLVAVAGLTMGRILVFISSDSGYSSFSTIDIEEPIQGAAVEEDGDLIVVSPITQQESFVYQYTACTKSYVRVQKLASSSFGEQAGISNSFIAQGNEDGTIQVSAYSWVYSINCSDPESLSAQPKIEKQEEIRDKSQKLSSRGIETPQNDSPRIIGGVFIILAVFCIAFFIFCFAFKKKQIPQNNESVPETASQIQKVIE